MSLTMPEPNVIPLTGTCPTCHQTKPLDDVGLIGPHAQFEMQKPHEHRPKVRVRIGCRGTGHWPAQ